MRGIQKYGAIETYQSFPCTAAAPGWTITTRTRRQCRNDGPAAGPGAGLLAARRSPVSPNTLQSDRRSPPLRAQRTGLSPKRNGRRTNAGPSPSVAS